MSHAAETQPQADPPRPPGPTNPFGEGDVDRPELYVAAAFAGAFVLAKIMKRVFT